MSVLPDDVGACARMSARELLAALDEMELAAQLVGLPGGFQPLLDELAQHRRVLAALVVQLHGSRSQVAGGRKLGEGPRATVTTGDGPPSDPPFR